MKIHNRKRKKLRFIRRKNAIRIAGKAMFISSVTDELLKTDEIKEEFFIKMAVDSLYKSFKIHWLKFKSEVTTGQNGDDFIRDTTTVKVVLKRNYNER